MDFLEGTLTAMNCLVVLAIVAVSLAGIGIGVFIGWLIWSGDCANAVI